MDKQIKIKKLKDGTKELNLPGQCPSVIRWKDNKQIDLLVRELLKEKKRYQKETNFVLTNLRNVKCRYLERDIAALGNIEEKLGEIELYKGWHKSFTDKISKLNETIEQLKR